MDIAEPVDWVVVVVAILVADGTVVDRREGRERVRTSGAAAVEPFSTSAT